MLEDMRKYVRLGVEALAAQRPEELVSRVQGFADQIGGLATAFLEWSAEARASLLREVKDLVVRQVQEMGLATREDLDVIRARLDRLERGEAGTGASARSASGSTKARRSGPKKTGRSGGQAKAPSARSGRGRSSGAGSSGKQPARKKATTGGSRRRAGGSRRTTSSSR